MRNIVCRLNDDDKFTIDDSYTDLSINDNSIYTYTFWNRDRKLHSLWCNIVNLPNFISNVGIDFLYISLFVYGVDRIFLREESDDAWTRNFRLYVPVLELDKWEKNRSKLETVLNFLSGDKWELVFRERDLLDYEIDFEERNFKSDIEKKVYNEICMFSGGLDSFIGVIDLLESEKKNRLFVSHYGGGKGTKEYQDSLREKLMSNYTLSESDFYRFYAAAHNGIEDTTRTRSFMFFAHAIALATSMRTNVKLVIPENGLISLNIPLTSSRLGSSSTRTTHPYYMKLLQDLLLNLGEDITIYNPYQFLTKGEMIIECKDKSFLNNNISNTMSCSHPDIGRLKKEKEARHCGYCLPCVIRRASIKRSGLIDSTDYRYEKFNQGDTAKMNLNSYKLGIEKFDKKFSFLAIQKAGPIKSDIKKYSELYTRGIKELKDFLGDY